MSFSIKDSYTSTIISTHVGIILLFVVGKAFSITYFTHLSLACMCWVGILGYAMLGASVFENLFRFIRGKLKNKRIDWWPRKWEIFLIHAGFVGIFYILISPYEGLRIRFWMYGNYMLIILTVLFVVLNLWKKFE
jgi:hypothetical protein